MIYIRTTVMLLLLLTVSSCRTVGPDYVLPETKIPDAWVEDLRSELIAAELDPQVLSEWWRTLQDPILDELIDTAIVANLDIRKAEAQVREARAQRAIARSNRFPTIQTGASGTRSDGSENTDSGGGVSELYSGSFDASWEIDVFGGQKRTEEAADADFQSAQESRRDVLITVLAEVALNYVELRTFQSRLGVAEKNLRNQEETLEIVDAQYKLGAVTVLDLNSAIANLGSTRSDIPALHQDITRARNRLALLTARQPGSLNNILNSRLELPTPSVQVVVGVPAETLRRRPDVRRDERRLAAETARIGVATAELYPKFNLTGTIGLESLSLGSLFSAASKVFNLGAALKWTLFDSGRKRQEIEVQNARQEQALIAYEASILKALEDVENSISAFTQEKLRYHFLSESAVAEERAAQTARDRYEAGATNFLTVLDAERELLRLQDSQVSSAGTIVSNLIRLYKALGGGWTPAPPAHTFSN